MQGNIKFQLISKITVSSMFCLNQKPDCRTGLAESASRAQLGELRSVSTERHRKVPTGGYDCLDSETDYFRQFFGKMDSYDSVELPCA